MKSTLLTFTALFISAITFSQISSGINHWSIGANFGGSAAHSPIYMGSPRNYQPHFVQGNVRYMINNRYGVMGTMQFNNFKIGETGYRTNYMNASIHGVVNVGDFIKLYTVADNSLGLLFHAGFGFAAMWQKGFWDSLGIEDPNTPYFDKSDDMIVVSFGLTPQYKINEHFSLNADFTFNLHNQQDRSFDFQNKTTSKTGLGASFLTMSIGATYYIGPRTRHADWTPTEQTSAPKAK
jgi:hypothetical protein